MTIKDKNGNDIDITGKILVMMKYSPRVELSLITILFKKYEPTRFKTLNAKEGNAAGIIIINGPNSGEDNLSKLAHDNVLQDAGSPIIDCQKRDYRKYFQTKRH